MSGFSSVFLLSDSDKITNLETFEFNQGTTNTKLQIAVTSNGKKSEL